VRLLVPIRVSRDDEAGSSPEDQRDVALDYQDTHTSVKITFTNAPDFNVSGATPIAERPGVREWLTPAKINEWDGIAVSEASRLSRDMYDYLGFVRDLIDRRGKIVVDLSDGTDSSTLKGRQILEDRILQAQRYREFSGEKRARKAQRTSDLGQWDGGRVTFGYRPEQRSFNDDYGRPRKGWFLVKDAEGTALIAERMVDMAFAGMSNKAIAAKLNEEGIPTAIGRQWRDSAVRRVLHSPSLAGFVVKMEGPSTNKHVQTIRRDRDGKPIRFLPDSEAILTEERWLDLQDVLATRARILGGPQARHMLWDVAFCRNCSQECEDELPCPEHDVRLYGARRIKHQDKGNRYWCKQCGYSIILEDLERYIEWELLREVGDHSLMEPRTIRGGDYSAEIIRLERKIERWRMDLDSEYDEDLEKLILKSEDRVAELTDGPREPDRVELHPVEPHTTIAQYWASLETPKDKNNYLRNTMSAFYIGTNGVLGQFGWMALDTPHTDFAGTQQMLRGMKLPIVQTWEEITDQMAGRPSSVLSRLSVGSNPLGFQGSRRRTWSRRTAWVPCSIR
jgi:DNA invertase Pin-like site-specific DNA recombinase